MNFDLVQEEVSKEELLLNTFPETRSFYLQISAKTTEMEIISNINSYAEAGFNMLCVDVFKNGYTIFPSEVMNQYKLPPINPIYSKTNPLNATFRESYNHSLKVYAVFDLLCVGDLNINKIGPILRKHHSWGLRNKDGHFSPIDDDKNHAFLCPSQPVVRRFLGNLCFETLDRYPFNGIIIDLVNYPFWHKLNDTSGCYCEHCVNKIEEKLKVDYGELEETNNPDLAQHLNSWRKTVLTNLMNYISLRLQKSRRPLHFILKVPGNFASNSDLQESLMLWNYWCQTDLFNEIILDFYPTDVDGFNKAFSNDLSSLYDKVLVLPTISTEDTSLISQLILSCREYEIPGFMYRNPELFEEPDLKKLKDVLGEPAEQIELNTLKSIAQLVLRIIAITYSSPQLFDFFQDFLKFIEIEGKILNVDRIERIIENLHSIENHLHDLNFDQKQEKKISSILSLIRRILFFHISFLSG